METSNLKRESAIKSIASLKSALDDINKLDMMPSIENISKEKLLITFRDSVIQRFKYSVDTIWKYLKEYLWQKKGVEQTHPKPVFKECFKAKLLNAEETELAINMVDSRNSTSHAYNEITADAVMEGIPEYYDLMQKLIARTE